ncbi:hypothetical protein RRG08_025113 [Elysia crispata]|uniref:Uncharacterized protein n=1 Tax=Elysia crispata TaxID=231223 RepID=A0AAE1AIQ2_9GAST|nr:hypothetical protein RRG08_025113 [Elysia crispata]
MNLLPIKCPFQCPCGDMCMVNWSAQIQLIRYESSVSACASCSPLPGLMASSGIPDIHTQVTSWETEKLRDELAVHYAVLNPRRAHLGVTLPINTPFFSRQPPPKLRRQPTTRSQSRQAHLPNVPPAQIADFDGHFGNTQNKGQCWTNTGTK